MLLRKDDNAINQGVGFVLNFVPVHLHLNMPQYVGARGNL
jgi:NADH/NAD ratio-sensing transcriptional regulator Rex